MTSTVIPSAEAAPTAAPAAPGKANPAGHRVAVDMLANRVHAILHRGGRMILDAGKVDFYKFVYGGWKGSWILGQKDGTTRVAYISGASASFAFPLDADGDGAAGKSLGRELDATVRWDTRSKVAVLVGASRFWRGSTCSQIWSQGSANCSLAACAKSDSPRARRSSGKGLLVIPCSSSPTAACT